MKISGQEKKQQEGIKGQPIILVPLTFYILYKGDNESFVHGGSALAEKETTPIRALVLEAASHRKIFHDFVDYTRSTLCWYFFDMARPGWDLLH